MIEKNYLSKLLRKEKISFLVQFIGHQNLVLKNSKTL